MARVHPRYEGWFAGRASKKSDLPNRVKFYLSFIVCSEFTDVTASRIIQTGGPRVGTHALEYLPLLLGAC